jgi:hypothetical protein
MICMNIRGLKIRFFIKDFQLATEMSKYDNRVTHKSYIYVIVLRFGRDRKHNKIKRREYGFYY